MKKSLFRIAGVCAFCFLFALSSSLALADDSGGIRTRRITETQLRSRVLHSKTADLTNILLPNGFGPAVAEVTISPNGKIFAISILEAPTLEIARSLQSSLKDWRFKPTPPNDLIYEIGKITFYFKKVSNRIAILDPSLFSDL